jgi:hypothetical protein
MKFTFAPESRPLEGYTIKRAIYRGGFGEVYYALTDAGREVALKLLQNNTEVELRGVHQCLNLSHPNLVTIFDVRQDGDGDHWIIMEYIAGDTLDVAIRKYPEGMPMQVVRHWLPGLAAGVGFLHDRGIVHRDLKPGNIFSENGVVKIGDVGLSKFITPSRRSAQTQSVGTVYYMAPEVAKGKYGKEVDIYALGIILYEMLTGRVPFEGESTGEILMKHLSEPPDLSVLPPRVRPVIGKALEKDPARRHRSVADFAEAFEHAVLGRTPVLEIPAESFAAAPASAGRQHVLLDADDVTVPGAPGPQRVEPRKAAAPPHGNWWWYVAAGAVLLFLTGGAAPLVQVAAVGALVYGGYACVRHLTNPGSATRRKGTVSAVPARSRGAASAPPPAVPVAVGATPPPQRRGVAPAAPRRKLQLTPGTPRTMALADRAAHFTGSAAIAVLLTGLLTAGIAFVAPDFFANQNGLSRLDEAAIGLFAITAVLAAWSISGTTKLLEGRKLQNSSRRLALLAVGSLVGLAAWCLDEALMVRTGAPSDAAFASIGSRPLIDAAHEPTWLAYVVFFGLLFALRRWWWHADTFRPSRLRVSSVLLTAMLAWLLSALWSFPHSWAVVWAAVVSSVVQLSSVWTPPESRRV